MSDKAEVYKMKMVDVEPQFLWATSANLSVVIRIKGYLSINDLKKSLNKVRKRHPLLNARILIDHSHDEMWYVSDAKQEFPLRVVSRRSDSQWFEEVLHEEKIPFVMEKGPLIRFILLQSEAQSELIIFCQHIICDGISLYYLARDILHFIANPNEPVDDILYPPAFIPKKLLKSKRLFSDIVVNLFFDIIQKLWEKKKVIFNQDDFNILHKAYWDKYNYCVLLMELPKNQTSYLVKNCHGNNVTVNSVLSTAFLAAYYDVMGGFKGIKQFVSVPVNIRNRLNKSVGDSFGLFVDVVKFRFKYNPKKSFLGNAGDFGEEVKSQIGYKKQYKVLLSLRRLSPSFLSAISFATYGNMIIPRNNYNEKIFAFSKDEKNICVKLTDRINANFSGTVIVNMGSLDFPTRYGALEVDRSILAVSASPLIDLNLAIITISGRLTLSLNYVEENISTETMNKIMDRAKNYLSDVIG